MHSLLNILPNDLFLTPRRWEALHGVPEREKSIMRPPLASSEYSIKELMTSTYDCLLNILSVIPVAISFSLSTDLTMGSRGEG